MSTWIFKGCAAVLTALTLSACDAATGLPFVPSSNGLTFGEGRVRIATIALAQGEVVLAAPEGYCIDKRSLKRTETGAFAVLARCDTLGVSGAFRGYDLALITVTSQPRGKDAPPPTAEDVARSAGGARVLDKRGSGGVALVRLADGPHSMDGVSRVHWRGAFAVGGHIVGLGLYAQDGSAVLGSQGASLLQELTRKTRSASASALAAARKSD